MEQFLSSSCALCVDGLSAKHNKTRTCLRRFTQQLLRMFHNTGDRCQSWGLSEVPKLKQVCIMSCQSHGGNELERWRVKRPFVSLQRWRVPLFDPPDPLGIHFSDLIAQESKAIYHASGYGEQPRMPVSRGKWATVVNGNLWSPLLAPQVNGKWVNWFQLRSNSIILPRNSQIPHRYFTVLLRLLRLPS